MQELGSRIPAAINDAGDVVGSDSRTLLAFIWHRGTAYTLPTLAGIVSGASGINNSSQIVGSSAADLRYPHACLWDGGSLIDLGTLDGIASHADMINDAGQIAGTAEVDNKSHAFFWQNGVMRDLGTLDGVQSWPTDINARIWNQLGPVMKSLRRLRDLIRLRDPAPTQSDVRRHRRL